MLIGGAAGKEGRGPRRRALWLTVTAISVLMISVSVSACGTSESPSSSGQELEPNNLVGHSELVKYPAGSVERTFLEFWSNLQFHSWADVAAYYDPHFRNFIGTAKIIEAKKVNGSAYPLIKPELVRTSSSHGVTTVYYRVINTEGARELASATWRKVGGNWLLVYDSRMDAELAQLAQEGVTLEESGKGGPSTSEPLSSKALRAGKEAAQLQAHFLQQELQLEEPSSPESP